MFCEAVAGHQASEKHCNGGTLALTGGRSLGAHFPGNPWQDDQSSDTGNISPRALTAPAVVPLAFSGTEAHPHERTYFSGSFALVGACERRYLALLVLPEGPLASV